MTLTSRLRSRFDFSKRQLFTFTVFIVLASLDNAAAGVLPPLYAIISRELNANEAALGLVTAVYFIIVAISAAFCGYRGDQKRRKPLLFYGTLIWVTAMLLTGLAQNYAQFLFLQMVTAVGVGGIASIGFSVISDIVPVARRGLALSLWGISQGTGGLAGALLAGTLGAYNWRYPFFAIAAAGLLFAILYLFTQEPQRGQSEPELAPVFATGQSYTYRINHHDLKQIFRQPSTRWLLLQSFFFSLAYGSILWVPRWAIARVQAEGYDLQTATIVGNLFIALFSIGALFSIFTGHIGDWWVKRNPRGRAYVAMIGLFASIPFFTLLYFTPLHGVAIPADGNLLRIGWAVFISLFTNHWVLLAFFLALAAQSLQAADPPNWAAMITDANLPEHRGTIVGASRLFRALGSALSVAAAGWLIVHLNTPAPDNYAITLALFQVVVIPAGICYYRVSQTIADDVATAKSTLARRALNNPQLIIDNG
ncbi:MAG: MFS transporter [Chloroflexi bacterium]|nr:MFS transporter [Chloroflexota bacterium]